MVEAMCTNSLVSITKFSQVLLPSAKIVAPPDDSVQTSTNGCKVCFFTLKSTRNCITVDLQTVALYIVECLDLSAGH